MTFIFLKTSNSEWQDIIAHFLKATELAQKIQITFIFLSCSAGIGIRQAILNEWDVVTALIFRKLFIWHETLKLLSCCVSYLYGKEFSNKLHFMQTGMIATCWVGMRIFELWDSDTMVTNKECIGLARINLDHFSRDVLHAFCFSFIWQVLNLVFDVSSKKPWHLSCRDVRNKSIIWIWCLNLLLCMCKYEL